MATMKTARVIGSKKLSARRHPDIPENEDVVETLEANARVKVDISDTTYNWQGRQYYKVTTESYNEGYMPVESIEFITGGRRGR